MGTGAVDVGAVDAGAVRVGAVDVGMEIAAEALGITGVSAAKAGAATSDAQKTMPASTPVRTTAIM